MAVTPGLCSVTYRGLAPDRIVELAVAAGLEAVEWGADVHVPPGDTARAAALAARCADAGLACPSYGSYLFAGEAGRDDVERVCESALALGATTVRIWCPFGTGPGASSSERRRITEAVTAIAGQVVEHGLEPAVEFHPGTLTETAASTRDLLDAAGVPGLTTYWQPAPGATPAEALAEFDAVADRVSNLHVFWWGPGSARRRLVDGEALWVEVLQRAASPRHHQRFAHLEFVPDDDPALLAAEAATLRRWLALAT